MPTRVNICDLSDFVIYYFNSEGIEITPLKLQKILYYIQAWHLVFFNKDPLFDEAPEAWVNGPVYRTVYNKYKKYKNKTISPGSKELDRNLKQSLEILNLTDEQEKLLNAVLKKYGQFNTGQLVYLTHSEAPWNDAREGLGPFDYCEQPISFESMYNYYNQRIQN